MAEQRFQRRLAAILAADVVGYSRRMEADEGGTLHLLQTLRREIFDPTVERNGGRIFKNTGDGALVEFKSANDAVTSAVEIQRILGQQKTTETPNASLELRIGISLGDVMPEGDDLYGNGVNIAARLQGLADAAGICVSGNVYEQVSHSPGIDFEDLGDQKVKNLDRPVRAYRVFLSGTPEKSKKSVGEIESVSGKPDAGMEQQVRFCTAADGTRIAYATIGNGPPLVRAATWLCHLEFDWKGAAITALLRELAKGRLLIRYDERGSGLSDWNVADISFEAFVQDLEAVVDAAGFERFDLLGQSHGCPVAIAYAVRHPERVARLILEGGFVRGRARRGDPGLVEQANAVRTLILQGWGQENPAFRQIFTAQIMPDAGPEHHRWFNELQRVSTSPGNAARIRDAVNQMDVTDLLRQVTRPTLVIHRRGDAAAPFEDSREMAAMIPDARFIALEGRNHIVLPDEAEWPRFVAEIESFLKT